MTCKTVQQKILAKLFWLLFCYCLWKNLHNTNEENQENITIVLFLGLSHKEWRKLNTRSLFQCGTILSQLLCASVLLTSKITRVAFLACLYVRQLQSSFQCTAAYLQSCISWIKLENLGLSHHQQKSIPNCRPAFVQWVEWFSNQKLGLLKSYWATHSAKQKGQPSAPQRRRLRHICHGRCLLVCRLIFTLVRPCRSLLSQSLYGRSLCCKSRARSPIVMVLLNSTVKGSCIRAYSESGLSLEAAGGSLSLFPKDNSPAKDHRHDHRGTRGALPLTWCYLISNVKINNLLPGLL